MRWTLRTIAVVTALWLCYVAWPFFVLYELAQAIQQRDVATVTRRLTIAAVRQSLTVQVGLTYLQLTGCEARLGPLGRGIAIAAAASIADPIVAKLISADRPLELLHRGWPARILAEPSSPAPGTAEGPIVQGLTTVSFVNLWQVFVQSEQGLRHFDIGVPIDSPPARRLKLQFRTHWVWKLSGIELPQELRVRLARELIRQI